MTIYRCDKCSREDGEEYPPCVYIDVEPGKPADRCPKSNYNGSVDCAEWVAVDALPDEIIEWLGLL